MIMWLTNLDHNKNTTFMDHYFSHYCQQKKGTRHSHAPLGQSMLVQIKKMKKKEAIELCTCQITNFIFSKIDCSEITAAQPATAS